MAHTRQEDDDYDELADEADDGYEVHQLRKTKTYADLQRASRVLYHGSSAAMHVKACMTSMLLLCRPFNQRQ